MAINAAQPTKKIIFSKKMPHWRTFTSPQQKAEKTNFSLAFIRLFFFFFHFFPSPTILVWTLHILKTEESKIYNTRTTFLSFFFSFIYHKRIGQTWNSFPKMIELKLNPRVDEGNPNFLRSFGTTTFIISKCVSVYGIVVYQFFFFNHSKRKYFEEKKREPFHRVCIYVHIYITEIKFIGFILYVSCRSNAAGKVIWAVSTGSCRGQKPREKKLFSYIQLFFMFSSL